MSDVAEQRSVLLDSRSGAVRPGASEASGLDPHEQVGLSFRAVLAAARRLRGRETLA